ncbi:MAG: hypothetical protein ACRCR6_10325 [Plesiomonas sp.]
MMIISGIMFVLAIGLLGSYVVITQRLLRQWKMLPTKQEYLKAYPGCELFSKIKCNHCHSRKIHHFGVDRAYSFRRQHVCTSCDSVLYRSESFQFPGLDGIFSMPNRNSSR